MSLKTYPDVIQGTPGWDDLRRGIVTASVVGQLVTAKTLKVASNPESRGLTTLLVAERITGHTDPTYVSADMERGWEDEPRALEAYSKWRERPVTEMGFMVRDDWGFPIGYSPDGLVEDGAGLLEVKSRRAKKQLATILADEVPAENMAQIQTGLLVAGAAYCDYISYSGGMPLWVRRVEPDERWFAAIVEAVAKFEAAAEAMKDAYYAAVEGLPMTERIELDADLVVI